MFDHHRYAARSGGETVFAVEAPPIRYGAGALAEVGPEAAALGMSRVALFTDPRLAGLAALATVTESLAKAGLRCTVYDAVAVEPTDRSFLAAIDFARRGDFDGYVSVGGGSVIDTAKAANLYATHPADLLAYVNAPIGQAKPVPGPLMPHIACPTTCGTGSECTGITICDFLDLAVKSGIVSRRLRPSLAVVDPTTTHSLPANVVASTGFDVLTHAIESYTARPFTLRDRPAGPMARPLSQGANPYSDFGSLEAIRLGGTYLVRAVRDPADHEARHALMFAATLAGVAFGNSGVHIPHAMSYAVAGLVEDYRARDYPQTDPMVPHGISVTVNAPAAFRFTAVADPKRHFEAAQALGADLRGAGEEDGGELLARRLIEMMRATDFPNGLSDIGYTRADIPALTKGAWAQQRLLVNAPRPVSETDLAGIFENALAYW